ncbi:MAG: DUF1254 domain-containing protein [Flavobacteriaceae bacterium]
MRLRSLIIVPLIIVLTIVTSCNGQSEKTSLSDKEQVAILSKAYLYAYPLLTMDYTFKVSTNTVSPNGMGKAPVNQLAGLKKFPKAGFTGVVRPNVDTYYSLVYADLSQGPLYIHIPATERYYLVPILNAYSDVITSLGSRTTGQGSLDIALVGPDYKGDVDSDLKVIRSNTSLNWLLGRVQVNDDEDGIDEVKNFQEKMIVRPLEQRNNPNYEAAHGVVNPDYNFVPMKAVDALSIEDYMNQMMGLMSQNPPQVQDSVFVKQMAAVGIFPGGTFDLSTYSKAVQEQLVQIPSQVQKGFEKMTNAPQTKNVQNGWNVNTGGLGDYGVSYALRAYVTKIGFGANTAQDAIYPNTAVDSKGMVLNGSNAYVLHFDKEALPPVKGFWSITAYDKDGFLIENSIDRYNLGDKKALSYNPDGSLDLYIQAEAPRGYQSNWLPVEAGADFELTFRMYWPEESILNRTWMMPGVQKVN